MRAAENAPRRAVAALLAVLVAVFAAACAMWLLQPAPGTAASGGPVGDAATRPALQSAPQLDLARYRAQKQRELDSVGPVAGEPGFARIPLSQAMDLMAERGLRAAPPHPGVAP
jgi:hypothetical protein